MNTMERRHGFTLIELLVVIAIIGLLSTILVVSSQRARVLARNARGALDARNFYNAFLLFAADNDGVLPKSACGGSAPVCLNASAAGASISACRGQANHQFCNFDGGNDIARCPLGQYAANLPVQLQPYLGFLLTSSRRTISPVQTTYQSGYDSLLYISHARPDMGTTNDGTNPITPETEGAYIGWFNDACREMTSAECPGFLLRSNDSCGNKKTGCALFLGKSSEAMGTCPYETNLPADYLSLQFF